MALKPLFLVLVFFELEPVAESNAGRNALGASMAQTDKFFTRHHPKPASCL